MCVTSSVSEERLPLEKFVSKVRREHCMQATYAKSMVKPPEASSVWLFWGNLSEMARQCKTATKVAEKLIKRKMANQNTGNTQPQKG